MIIARVPEDVVKFIDILRRVLVTPLYLGGLELGNGIHISIYIYTPQCH